MKPRKLLLIGILILFFACNRDDNAELNIDGQYIGTFERNGIVANVELNFNNGSFSGQSDRPNFPAIFFGKYSTNSRFLKFENRQLFLTTEFDPNLILDGNWNFENNKNSLTMTNSIGDVYILRKQ